MNLTIEEFNEGIRESVSVSNQITTILSRHCNASLMNPAKVFEALASNVSLMLLLKEDTERFLKGFSIAVTGYFDDPDAEEVELPSWEHVDLSLDAPYEGDAAYKELKKFLANYLGYSEEIDRKKYGVLLQALCFVCISLLDGCFSDEDGLVSTKVIEEHLDHIRDCVRKDLEFFGWSGQTKN